MSWGFVIAGKPNAVAKAVKETSYVPQGLKDAVGNICGGADQDAIVVVESNGHMEALQSDGTFRDGCKSGGGTMSFKVVKAAAEPE